MPSSDDRADPVDGSGLRVGDPGLLIFRWAACEGNVTAATALWL